MPMPDELDPVARPRGIRASTMPKESALPAGRQGPPNDSRTPFIPAAHGEVFTGRNNPPQPFTAWNLVALCGELGFIIALPLLLFLWGGIWFDRRFNTTPWVMLLGVLLALTSSSILIARRINRR